jgi:hypothetical protein
MYYGAGRKNFIRIVTGRYIFSLIAINEKRPGFARILQSRSALLASVA